MLQGQICRAANVWRGACPEAQHEIPHLDSLAGYKRAGQCIHSSRTCSGLLLLWRAGDKPRAFVGSRQWVGAIELGFVLDTLLGVTCRVITVSAGADMPSKAREIAHHFDTQVPLSQYASVVSCLFKGPKSC